MAATAAVAAAVARARARLLVRETTETTGATAEAMAVVETAVVMAEGPRVKEAAAMVWVARVRAEDKAAMVVLKEAGRHTCQRVR